MYYLIHWNPETAQKISARFTKKSDMDDFKALLPDYDFIETGAFSYWLMKHDFPKLAMLSFWGL